MVLALWISFVLGLSAFGMMLYFVLTGRKHKLVARLGVISLFLAIICFYALSQRSGISEP